MSYCEVCGSEIAGPPFVITVENVSMRVCRSCSRHGKQQSGGSRNPQKKIQEEFTFSFPSVRNDYSKIIREARERLKLSQEELGSRIKEEVSVVKLLEEGKFKPDPAMARKIENSLGIRLIEI